MTLKDIWYTCSRVCAGVCVCLCFCDDLFQTSKQSIPKEISPEYSMEGLMPKLKLHTLATWCEEPTHLKRPWCWERLGAGGEGYDRGWDGWMASLTQWTWVWVNSGSWWCTGRPGVLQSMGSQRVRYDWATKLNWTEKISGQPGSSLCDQSFLCVFMFWVVGWWHGELIFCLFSERGSDKIPVSSIPAQQEFSSLSHL